ncbi:PucR family transcriptional regulator [Compostimonas suwonensis]|nr:helix-turn-helix domain-containing protein [Compostimonas suwonensis]
MSIHQMVNHIAQVVGRPALLEDRKQRVVAYSPQSDAIDEVRRKTILQHHAGPDVSSWLLELGVYNSRESVHIPPNPRFEMLPRLCIPIRKADVALGHLWFIEAPDAMDPADVARADDLSERLADEWIRWRAQQDFAVARTAECVRELLLGTGDARMRAADDVLHDGHFVPGTSVRAFVLRPVAGARAPEADELAEALERTTRSTVRALGAGHALTLVRKDHTVVLVPSSDEPGRFPSVEKTAQLLLAASENVVDVVPGVSSVVVGVGSSSASLHEAQLSYEDALRAAQIGASFGITERVVRWDQLGVYRGLYTIASLGIQSTDFQAGFERIMLERDGQALLDTAECYLNLGCRVQDAAARLNLHRTSLYHRLGRIERILGIDLQNGVERLGLHLAIMLMKIGTSRSVNPVDA